MRRFRWWRRLRGGRWELLRAGGDSFACWWRRVDMFDHARFRSGGACVIGREDWRR